MCIVLETTVKNTHKMARECMRYSKKNPHPTPKNKPTPKKTKPSFPHNTKQIPM